MTEIKRIDKNNLKAFSSDLNYLIESFSSLQLEKIAEDDRSYFFIALIDKLSVGYALAYKFPSLSSNCYLSYLYDIEVLQSHRRKGIGRDLIDYMIITLKNEGVKEVWLGTAIDNVAGQALFKSAGAEKSDEIFHDYTFTF